MFNQFDFEDWVVETGTWRVTQKMLTGSWGSMRFVDKLPAYRLRLVYRATALPGEEQEIPTLWIHKDPDRWSGARLALSGPSAGAASRIKPDPKYAEEAEAVEDPPKLKKESPYKPEDWNEIEVAVKGHEIHVELNGKVVFESLKGALIMGWEKGQAKDFPGCLYITATAKIEIKAIFLRSAKGAP